MVLPLTGSFLSRKQVTLGRLVLDLQNPGQGFCPYTEIEFKQEDVDKAPFRDIELELDEKNTSRFSLKLTKLFGANSEASRSSSNNLKAKEATRYELLNSPDVLTRILTQSRETREWLEKVHKYSPVHFAVALITVFDASLNAASEESSKVSLSVTAPLGEVVAPGSSTVPLVGDSLDVQTKIAKERGQNQNAKFLAPGDRIAAVQYRRIKFKGYKSENGDGAFLEKGCRWKKYTGTDVDRGEGEDILEATLEQKPMLDGLEERYSFHSEQLENDILLIVCPVFNCCGLIPSSRKRTKMRTKGRRTKWNEIGRTECEGRIAATSLGENVQLV